MFCAITVVLLTVFCGYQSLRVSGLEKDMSSSKQDLSVCLEKNKTLNPR